MQIAGFFYGTAVNELLSHGTPAPIPALGREPGSYVTATTFSGLVIGKKSDSYVEYYVVTKCF
jgi:hypothetical protein